METHLTLRPAKAPEGMEVPEELEGRRVVAFPDRPTKPLDPNGERVALSTYWRKRLAAGDVEKVGSTSTRKGRASAPQE